MLTIELPYEEKIATGCSHMVKVTHADLTEAAANTVQALTVTVPAGFAVGNNGLFKLKTTFSDSLDAAFNVTTLGIGDNTSATTWMTAKELNVNGTEITFGAFTATAGKAYPAADTLKLTFTSMAAKALLTLDAGEVHIFFRLVDLNKAST